VSKPPPTAEDVAKWLRLFVEPGMVIELRILGVIDNPKYTPYIISGYFDCEHLDQLAAIAMFWTGNAEGCHVTVNPVIPDLLARANNRVKRRPKCTTTDQEIVRRIGLVFDVDPQRPAGISATDLEKRLALERIRQLVDELGRRGWPAPILANSGNGYHARYKVDLPVDDSGQVERVLKAADAMFSDDQVKIDTTLYNPARIIKLYGTKARKGDHTADRPHRWTGVMLVPDDWRIVPSELLDSFAAEVQLACPMTVSHGQRRNDSCIATTPPTDTTALDRARAYLLSPNFPDSIAGQNGHDVLYRVASELVDGFGLKRESAFALLAEWNEAKAKPPESAQQLEHKLSDAIRNHPVPSLSRLNAGRGRKTSDKSDSRKWPKLAPETVVMCVDRDPPNYGYVAKDLGDEAQIRWESSSGETVFGTLHKSLLLQQDGSPLAAGELSQLALVTTRASDVRPVPVSFLAGQVIPAGKLVTVAGLGGTGKGMFWINLVADLTRGRATFGLSYPATPAVDVLLIGCEDGYGDTIIPRLLASDADLDRVHLLDGVRDASGRLLAFSLAHLEPLATYLKDHPEIRLVIIDPIAEYVGRAGVKDHWDSDVRTLLEPLSELANRCGATILTVKHLNKDEAKTVASRVGGSVAYVNVPRACFVVAKDPDDETRRVLAPIKWNLNTPMPPSIAWSMEPAPSDRLDTILATCEHLSDEDKTALAGQLYKLNWQGVVDCSADDLLRLAPRRSNKQSDDDVDRAAKWLKSRLADGPVGSIVAAKEGDLHLGRRWSASTMPVEERRKFILDRTKWWREKILKGILGGFVKKFGFRPALWCFCLPEHQWPPGEHELEAARCAEEAEGVEEAHEGPGESLDSSAFALIDEWDLTGVVVAEEVPKEAHR
jgi:hypothetical protein